MNEELRRFVRKALEQKVSREAIRAALTEARWRKEDINEALSAYVDVAGVAQPVPWRKPSLSAREAFQYLMTYFCLFLSVWALGNLLFNAVNWLVPDLANEYNNWSTSEIHLDIAMLVVTAPIYVLMTLAANKAMREDPAKRDSSVRKWLTYLTLFIAGGTAIGDMITLVYGLLEGPQDNLAARFFLKVGVVLALSASVFAYYLRDLRKDERPS